MNRRINIVLPEDTIRVLDRIAQKGTRSRLIAEAVRSYVAGKARANPRERLKEGAMARADRDLDLAREWFPRH